MRTTVKVTLRLPDRLQDQLRQRTRGAMKSLNTEAVETLQICLTEDVNSPLSERERALRVLRESGLWQPLGPEWAPHLQSPPSLDFEQWREKLKGVPSLSEAIIEEREPR